MKKIITILLLIFASSFTTPQSTSKDSLKVTPPTDIIKEIKEIASSIESDKAYIKEKSEENRKRLLKEIPHLNKKEDMIMDRIIKKLADRKKEKSEKPEKEIIYRVFTKTDIKKTKKINIIKDSACVSYQREFLGKRKCVEWAYIK